MLRRVSSALVLPLLALSTNGCGLPSNGLAVAPLAPQTIASFAKPSSVRPSSGAAYNAVTQFSVKSNPNGVWSYLYSGGLLTESTKSCAGIKKLLCWYNGLSFPDSVSVIGNKTGETQSVPNGIGGSITYQTNYLGLDGQDDSLGSDVRFTTPAAGSYVAEGYFEGINTSEQSHPVAIEVNGTTVFYAIVSGYESPVPFKLKLTLNQGDTVDFISEPYGNGEFLGTGLAAKMVLR